MFKLDVAAKTLAAISSTTLVEANVLERTDLQEAILKSWEVFYGELLYDELFLIGAEVKPHDSCDVRIDILALSRDGTPVVFELKRHRDRLQLLQAISYAAMVAEWKTEDYLRMIVGKMDDESTELRGLLESGLELRGPEIVIVAETFDPEVILAANWLSKFKVPISAFAISVVDHRGDTLVTLDKKFPMRGLDELYVRRSVRSAGPGRDITAWDEALQDILFPFAKRAVDVFSKRIAGSPSHRSFFSIYADSPLGRMRINVKRKYLKVYTVDQSPEAERTLRQRLGATIAFKTWGDESTKNSGFTFKIETEQQFDQFLKAVGEIA